MSRAVLYSTFASLNKACLRQGNHHVRHLVTAEAKFRERLSYSAKGPSHNLDRALQRIRASLNSLPPVCQRPAWILSIARLFERATHDNFRIDWTLLLFQARCGIDQEETDQKYMTLALENAQQARIPLYTKEQKGCATPRCVEPDFEGLLIWAIDQAHGISIFCKMLLEKWVSPDWALIQLGKVACTVAEIINSRT